MGLGAAYINGVMIPSTSDPVGTPVVNNTAPGQNLQAAVSQVPYGTYSNLPGVCNTAGGYVDVNGVCVLPGQPGGVAVPVAGVFVSSDPGAAPAKGSPAAGAASTVPASGVQSMLDSAVSWVQANPLLAAALGLGAVLVVSKL